MVVDNNELNILQNIGVENPGLVHNGCLVNSRFYTYGAFGQVVGFGDTERPLRIKSILPTGIITNIV